MSWLYRAIMVESHDTDRSLPDYLPSPSDRWSRTMLCAPSIEELYRKMDGMRGYHDGDGWRLRHIGEGKTGYVALYERPSDYITRSTMYLGAERQRWRVQRNKETYA